MSGNEQHSVTLEVHFTQVTRTRCILRIGHRRSQQYDPIERTADADAQLLEVLRKRTFRGEASGRERVSRGLYGDHVVHERVSLVFNQLSTATLPPVTPKLEMADQFWKTTQGMKNSLQNALTRGPSKSQK